MVEEEEEGEVDENEEELASRARKIEQMSSEGNVGEAARRG